MRRATSAPAGQQSGESAGVRLRSYGGEGGDTRVARRRAALLDAGLDLLGGGDVGAVTVRGVCRHAGLTARYFYESFESVDDLVSVMYDGVTAEITTSALAAFEAGGDVRAKVVGAVGAIVDVIDADRRKGRLLFSQALLSPVIAAKRSESIILFAGLTMQSATDVLDLRLGSAAASAIAQYQVGGFSRLLAAWLDGDVRMDRDGIVDLAVMMLMAPTEKFGASGGGDASDPTR